MDIDIYYINSHQRLKIAKPHASLTTTSVATTPIEVKSKRCVQTYLASLLCLKGLGSVFNRPFSGRFITSVVLNASTVRRLLGEVKTL